MPAPARMPNFVRGVAAAGVETLRAIAAKLADWQLSAPIDVTRPDATSLATEYLTKLKHPSHVFSALPEDAQDRVAVAIGCVPKAAWRPPAPIPPDMPSYKRPSWAKDVYAVLFAEERAPEPTPRVETRARVSHARAWPELGSVTAWRRARSRAPVADALAAALGKGWKAAAPAGRLELPRVRSAKLGLAFVAIPGGTLAMGLSAEEQRELVKRVKGRGAEAAAHVRELAKLARPVHTVKVAPLLCAETPLVAKHAAKLRCEGDASNAHEVLRVDSETAAAVATRTSARLLAEAEWEWIARAAGAHAWLCADEDPEAWAERTLATALDGLEHPLGIRGLGWGEWIDDGWHPSYAGAPARSIAWAPKTRPEVVRGGALALWPWQAGGEIVLCHAAARDRSGGAARNALRLALDLPARPARTQADHEAARRG